MTRRVSLAACAVLVAVLPSAAFAQARLTGADLEGTVVDQSGAILAGASVTVKNVDTNVTRTAATDERGRYAAAALPPGTYDITVTAQGFAPRTQAGIVLLLGQSITVDFRLAVAGTAEQLTVTGESPVVEVTNTAVSSVLNRQQIDNLPINGRNFISFSVITPGVTTDRTPQQGASATSGLSFTGQRARSNNIMVDTLMSRPPMDL